MFVLHCTHCNIGKEEREGRKLFVTNNHHVFGKFQFDYGTHSDNCCAIHVCTCSSEVFQLQLCGTVPNIYSTLDAVYMWNQPYSTAEALTPLYCP